MTYLDLEWNQITSIESGDFAGFPNLQWLELRLSQITSIESIDFAGLDGLTQLALNNNQITSIESGDFAGLSNLTELSLNNNQITSIENGDFAGLPSFLQYLTLYWNQITSIESGDFAGLPNLQWLDLNYNCLNTEDSLVTSYLDTLPGIYNYREQLVCVQIQYSPSTSTRWPVTGSLSFVWPTSMVAVLSGENPDMTVYDHVFTGNGSHLYDYSSMTDSNTYLWSRYMTNNMWIPHPDTVLWSVTWIDTTPPLWTLSYSTTGITNQSVIATLTLNETGSVTNNSGSTSYIFSGNGDFIFEYQDSVGNTGATTASITWIDTTAPTITLNGSSTFSGYVGDTYTDAGASWTDAVAGTGTLIGSWIVNTVLAGTYIITYTVTDTAGNTSTATRTVILTAKPTPPIPTPSGGGWGGWGQLVKDNCPDGDYSPSYYDKACGTKPTTTWTDLPVPTPQDTIVFDDTEIYNESITDGYCYDREKNVSIIDSSSLQTSQEFKKALTLLYAYDMTMFDAIDEFKPQETLTREQAAKIFSNFATKVLCRQIDTTRETSYIDIDGANTTLKPYITMAYQLWLMKWSNGNFRPFDIITKAEFNAVIVRMILNTYLPEDTGDTWYSEYNKVSTTLGIITQATSDTPILRKNAAVMLLRAYKNQPFIIDDGSYRVENRD